MQDGELALTLRLQGPPKGVLSLEVGLVGCRNNFWGLGGAGGADG